MNLPRCSVQIACVLLVGTICCRADELILVDDGSAACTIVKPADSDQWIDKAAGWLQDYLQRATGAKVHCVSDAAPTTGTIISLGPTSLAAKAGVDATGLEWDGCKLVVKGDVLYLIGRDDVGTESHDWVGARGTNRAAIKFLEDFCGVRWFLPGPNGVLVPKTTTVRVPRDLDVTFQPAFAFSDGRSVYDVNVYNEPGRSLSAQANNYRKGIKVQPGGHTYYHAVSADQYFDEHPEYFALLDGQRTRKGNHLCTSHPDVRRLLTKWTQGRFDKGHDWVSIGQEDGYLRCRCDDCEKQDDYRFWEWRRPGRQRWETFQKTVLCDTPCERLFLLHKQVIDDVAKTHPNKKVMLMCYAPTAWPSKKVEYFGDNVIGELMNLDPEYINAWKDRVSGLTGFVYWFNTTIPMGLNMHMTPKEVADRIRYLHKQGFVGLSVDPEGTWGIQGPVYWAMGRLLGDPSLDEQALVEEYCHGVYGQAAEPMLAFFDLLHQRLSLVVPIADDDISADARNTQLQRWMRTPELFLSMYPPDVLATLEHFITQAEARANTEMHEGWVRLSRDHFDFIKLLTEMVVAHRAWQLKPTDANREELQASVKAFEAWRLKVVSYPKEYTDAWFPGHETFGKWLVADLEDTSTAFYCDWQIRRAEVLEKGLRGRAMGYGQSYYYSFIKEPLTLDLTP